jgi:hypothetical protein
LKTGHGGQGLVNSHRQKFLGCGPYEGPSDSADSLINQFPRPSGFDHRRLDDLERPGSELPGRGATEQGFHESERLAKLRQLVGRRAVDPAVVLFGVAPEREQDFIYRNNLDVGGRGLRQSRVCVLSAISWPDAARLSAEP